LELHNQIEKVRGLCRDCSGIRFPAWHSQEKVRAFYKALDALNLEEDLATAQIVFTPLVESLKDFINSGHGHVSTEQLLQAVNTRNSALYQNTNESLSSLHILANEYSFACGVQSRFHACAPQTCQNYNSSYSEPAWDEHFAEFETVWIWAKTDRWLDEISDKERPKQIQRELENSILREQEALKNLAASKAWQHCMTNLGVKEEIALKAWKQAVGRIREHGKDAEYWREVAREKLDECRNAIPAWVMPLYQVVQTTSPGRASFNIAIIDEASQSGPEALFLNYIADTLIVVGDDKQITPMYIGRELEHTHFLRKKYLDGIPNAALLMPGRDASLFSQAYLRFRDHIQLREHFRCMPEIIQFSNNLSYFDAPLIPLRQYGVNRLEPVHTVHIKDGYRKGESDEIENPPEAEAIVAQIAECCEDPAYAGKTFGVISLMGNRQAELINSLLMGKNGIGAQEMENRRLVCGRPYDFQGDERDVIFLSMVDAPQDGQPCRMIRDADTQRRFNVAVSRAKDQLWLFHSATINDLRPECLRYRLLEYCLNPAVMQPEEIGETTLAELRRMAHNPSRIKPKRGETIPGTQFESWFEVDVFFKIIDRGYRILPQFHVNTRRIDLVVEGLRGRLAVECNGDEVHMDRWEEDQIRQRELERAGWTFWTVWGSSFYRDPDATMAELWEILERLKITPRHMWESDRKESETGSSAEDRNSVSEIVKEYHANLEDDEEDQGEEKSPFAKNTKDLFGIESESVQTHKRRPEEMPPLHIQNAILQSLQKCPNCSCTLKSLTSRVLKELGLLTRGNPRLEFEKRVMRNLGVLKGKGLVEEYKSKNRRIRLLA
jgi:very-short-patch-repair endonuclease